MNKIAQEKTETAIAQLENTGAITTITPELAAMYNENANVGAENLVGGAPILRIHATGRSSANELPDGTEPNDGWFFYKPTSEQFKEVLVHVLSISEGFRMESMSIDPVTGKKKQAFTQIMSGLIVREGQKPLPFFFYFSGKKLAPMWEFGKKAALYTKAKPVSIPLYTLLVKLTTVSEKTDYGKAWVVQFEIMKNADDSPIIVTDPAFFGFLRKCVDRSKLTVDAIIQSCEPEKSDEVDLYADEPVKKEEDKLPF